VGFCGVSTLIDITLNNTISVSSFYRSDIGFYYTFNLGEIINPKFNFKLSLNFSTKPNPLDVGMRISIDTLDIYNAGFQPGWVGSVSWINLGQTIEFSPTYEMSLGDHTYEIIIYSIIDGNILETFTGVFFVQHDSYKYTVDLASWQSNYFGQYTSNPRLYRSILHSVDTDLAKAINRILKYIYNSDLSPIAIKYFGNHEFKSVYSEVNIDFSSALRQKKQYEGLLGSLRLVITYDEFNYLLESLNNLNSLYVIMAEVLIVGLINKLL
jgi:hypothetical protein